LPRNGWTESIGMGGRLRPELPAGITRNTHTAASYKIKIDDH